MPIISTFFGLIIRMYFADQIRRIFTSNSAVKGRRLLSMDNYSLVIYPPEMHGDLFESGPVVIGWNL